MDSVSLVDSVPLFSSFTEFGSLRFSTFVPLNASVAALSSWLPAPKLTFARLLDPENAELPIVLTDEGITTLVIWQPANARLPIFSTYTPLISLGITTFLGASGL